MRKLGRRLKEFRDKAQETLAEASSAVEIDVKSLANIELGHDRPSEDVLLLLLSHFGAKDDEALKMWELAGYSMGKIPVTHMSNGDLGEEVKSAAANIFFTDVVDVTVNNYGVVMNFMQNNGPSNKPKSISRVGMSREHAKSILQILQATLAQTEHNVQTRLATPENPDLQNRS